MNMNSNKKKMMVNISGGNDYNDGRSVRKVNQVKPAPAGAKPVSGYDNPYSVIRACKEAVTTIGSVTMPPKIAANIVLMEIRSLFFNTIRSDTDKFDLDAVKYMDSLVFDDIGYIIAYIFECRQVCATSHYTAKIPQMCAIMKRMIKNTAEMIEYNQDMEDVYNVIDQLQEELVL